MGAFVLCLVLALALGGFAAVGRFLGLLVGAVLGAVAFVFVAAVLLAVVL